MRFSPRPRGIRVEAGAAVASGCLIRGPPGRRGRSAQFAQSHEGTPDDPKLADPKVGKTVNSPRALMAEIAALPLDRPVRVLTLSADHERMISISGMRAALPEQVRLLSGPGCAASICPQADLYQAIQLASRHPLTLHVAESMLRLPVGRDLPGAHCLEQARREGADVRPISAPVEAVMAAQREPWREMVLFVAGFETVLAPLAGMIVDGLPENLSLLISGRRVEPLIEQLLRREPRPFEALLLPGNRCAVTGTSGWERISDRYRVPAAVAGYTPSNILTALHRLLRRHCAAEAGVDNCYRTLVRIGGHAMGRDQLSRVFEYADGEWRGLGRVPGSALRLRHAYRVMDADQRYPDYRDDVGPETGEMPLGCECAAVLLGEKTPRDCRQFSITCQASSPYGPCMASADGTCSLHSAVDRVA